MFWRLFMYEGKRSFPLFLVWAGISFCLALSARLRFFSVTDMPLFYLMLFGSVSIMLYRYYSTMYGKEAELLFTVDLSSEKQMLMRYTYFIIWCTVTALVIGLALAVQGEDLSKLLGTIPVSGKFLAAAEVTFSAFTLIILISSALSVSCVHPFSEHSGLSFVFFLFISFGLIGVLSKATIGSLPSYLVITGTGDIVSSTISNIPSSISFSLNTLIWDLAISVICMIGIPIMIKRKLIVK